MASPVWLQITQWRDSGRQVKVGPLDGRLMLFFVLLLLFPGFLFFILTIFALIFFYFLQYIGYTLPNAFRKFKVIIAGKRRNGVHYWRQHRFRY